jgi:hypothetical protein
VAECSEAHAHGDQAELKEVFIIWFDVSLRCPCVTQFGLARALIPCGNRPLKRPRAISELQKRCPSVTEFGFLLSASVLFSSVLPLVLFDTFVEAFSSFTSYALERGGRQKSSDKKAMRGGAWMSRMRSRKEPSCCVCCVLFPQAHFPFLPSVASVDEVG